MTPASSLRYIDSPFPTSLSAFPPLAALTEPGPSAQDKTILEFKDYFRDKYAPKLGEALATEAMGKGMEKRDSKPTKATKNQAKKNKTSEKDKLEAKLSHLAPEQR